MLLRIIRHGIAEMADSGREVQKGKLVRPMTIGVGQGFSSKKIHRQAASTTGLCHCVLNPLRSKMAIPSSTWAPTI